MSGHHNLHNAPRTRCNMRTDARPRARNGCNRLEVRAIRRPLYEASRTRIRPECKGWRQLPIGEQIDAPGSRTRLESVSHVMIDKIVSVPRAAVKAEIGNCDAQEIEAVEDGLRRWFEL